MLHDVEDTIVAIASAHGGAYSGILRLSGANSLNLVDRVFQPTPGHVMDQQGAATCVPGKINAGPLIGDVPAETYCWPNEKSYTRQPCVEIHTVGSIPILNAIERSLIECGARLARPGEFTMRAFLAGRMDLSQAEAVIGVIDARDQTELQTALKQLAGGISTPLHDMRESLLGLLADLEAGLDFVEEDIEFISSDEILKRLTELDRSLQAMIEQIQSRSVETGGPRVVLIGKPNVGKSSLFNALAGDDRAIVSNQAGTTRDYLCTLIEHNTLAFTLVDSAGINEFEQLKNAAPYLLSEIEVQAENQTRQQQQAAHLILHCSDTSEFENIIDGTVFPNSNCQSVIRVATKNDLDPIDTSCLENCISTCSFTGEGLEELKDSIVDHLVDHQVQESTSVSIAMRCLESLQDAQLAIGRAIESVDCSLGDEITAIETREALNCLGRITGTVYTDDILDRIFSQFCIGK